MQDNYDIDVARRVRHVEVVVSPRSIFKLISASNQKCRNSAKVSRGKVEADFFHLEKPEFLVNHFALVAVNWHRLPFQFVTVSSIPAPASPRLPAVSSGW